MKEKIFSFLSIMLGPVLINVLPKTYLRRLKDKSIVWGFTHKQGSIADKIMMRLVRPYFWKEYYGKSDAEIRQINREQYWGSEAGKLWHEEIRKKYSSPELFQNEFVKRRETMTNMLCDFMQQFPGKYETLCEIGTGNGLYIHYLYEKYSSLIKRWVGIDLNEEQIRINANLYKDYPIVFISTEAGDWMSNNANTGTIFLAVGTLECFTQAELEEFLSEVKTKYNSAAIALVEPVGFDLNTEKQSTPRGLSMFNHNYPYLLDKTGFSLFNLASTSAEPGNPENKNQLLSIIAYT